jgi:hypothetical protein
MKQTASKNQSDRSRPAAAPDVSKTSPSVATAYPDQRSAPVVQAVKDTAAPQEAPTEAVVQRAGTKPNTASVDGRYRIKLSSARERYIYENKERLELKEVLPGYHMVIRYYLNTSNLVERVDTEDVKNIKLKTPISKPEGGKHLVVIDTVGFEEPKQELDMGSEQEGLIEIIEQKDPVESKKIFMDVKIGTHTKSGEQFELEGAWAITRLFKNIEHNLKDLNRDSRDLGYDIDKENKASFLNEWNKGSKLLLSRAVNNILGQLGPLVQKLNEAPVTFVGSSLFMVFNLTNPEASAVKLIDPDHPILFEDPDRGDAPKDVMRPGKFKETPGRYMSTGHAMSPPVFIPGRKFKDYREKWQSGFQTGAVNFIKWLNQFK